ncbi:sodium:alanine symporter family protein [Desulfovibrio sp. OttesenSCG-928-F07]|nr:sodium:alanine symporter family protein [Desulfovibrio sp. OttesenSCG-928-F07]
MFTDFLNALNNIVWGPIMLVLLVGTGIFLTIGLKCMPWRKTPYAFRMMWRGRKAEAGSSGELTPWNSLMTALAATVGTGNIAGVATAIFMGGPGALFWMWCTALVGMATKFAESALSVKYRERTPEGHYVGGPMFFIKNGLGKRWVWLGTAFAIFGALAGFGIGNMVQSNSIVGALLPVLPESWTAGSAMAPTDVINLSPIRLIVAGILLVGIGAVLLGGLKRIGDVAGKVVPLMCVFYIVCALGVMIVHITEVPRIFAMVISEAFTPTAAVGGFAGSTIAMAMRFGIARGLFSNEAGMGSAPIVAASASINSPVRMGLISMLGTFIDTIVVCSMTGFAILVTGSWTSGLSGSALTSHAFESVFPGLGSLMVAVGSALFAFSTILGWCVYSERCVIYLFGDKGLKPFRFIFTLAVPIGVVCQLDTVWLIADTLNALMAIPNLIGILLLSPVLFQITKTYFLTDDGSGTHTEDEFFK